jgi:hypothetical protein
LLVLLLVAGSRSRAQVPNEYEVKAAFLAKFASFVEWPEGSGAAGGSRRCIAVVGQDPFGAVLDEVVKGKFAIRRFRPGQEPSGCQIVFVSASEGKRLAPLLEHLRRSATLTVGDMPAFCEQGGMINLALTNDHVSLEINPEAAGQARLQLSSKLLSLARIVRQAGQAGR